jgi:hypothetical protein
LKEIQLSIKEISTHIRQKLKPHDDLFHIKQVINPATSVKKKATHEDETTILSKTVDQLGSNRNVLSVIFSPPVARSGTEVR